MIEAASEQPALEVGDQHGFFRVQQFRGLGHEMDAGQDDHIGVGARRLARQCQAVADDVGDGVENVGRLVVVREDDGVALPLQPQDRIDVIGHHRPFEGRDVPLHTRVNLGQRQDGCGGLGEAVSSTISLLMLIMSILMAPEKPGECCPAIGYAEYEDKFRNRTVKIRSPDNHSPGATRLRRKCICLRSALWN